MNGFMIKCNFNSSSDKNKKGFFLAVYIIFSKNIFDESDSSCFILGMHLNKFLFNSSI